MSERISDEMLNAYIDGELDDADCQHLLDALQCDPELHVRLGRLQQVRTMTRLAYDEPRPESRPGARRWSLSASLAASLLLAVGIVTGWVLNVTAQRPDSPLAELGQFEAPTDQVWRIVMHVNTLDDYMQNTLLDETEYMLNSFLQSGRKVEVEIVAYGPGLELLMPERSMYTDRIMAMQQRYPNLTFTACERSYKRLKREMGGDLQLVANTRIAPSGIREIIKRQQEGWHYIRL